jgi:hypothetical protein
MRAQVGKFTLSGDAYALVVTAATMSARDKSPGTFTVGTIQAVEVNVGKEQYIDLEIAAVAAFAVE